jgi:hypothetical protein
LGAVAARAVVSVLRPAAWLALRLSAMASKAARSTREVAVHKARSSASTLGREKYDGMPAAAALARSSAMGRRFRAKRSNAESADADDDENDDDNDEACENDERVGDDDDDNDDDNDDDLRRKGCCFKPGVASP